VGILNVMPYSSSLLLNWAGNNRQKLLWLFCNTQDSCYCRVWTFIFKKNSVPSW